MTDTSPAAKPTPSPKAPPLPHWVVALLILLTSTIAGILGGLLAYAIEKSIPAAILYGFGAFTACCFLLIAFTNLLKGDQQ